MIYVVTNSAKYYPQAGADDWELVTRDRDSAMLRALGLQQEAREQRHTIFVHVFAINEDNLHVQELPL